jgi:hypothetical protein
VDGIGSFESADIGAVASIAFAMRRIIDCSRKTGATLIDRSIYNDAKTAGFIDCGTVR